MPYKGTDNGDTSTCGARPLVKAPTADNPVLPLAEQVTADNLSQWAVGQFYRRSAPDTLFQGAALQETKARPHHCGTGLNTVEGDASAETSSGVCKPQGSIGPNPAA